MSLLVPLHESSSHMRLPALSYHASWTFSTSLRPPHFHLIGSPYRRKHAVMHREPLSFHIYPISLQTPSSNSCRPSSLIFLVWGNSECTCATPLEIEERASCALKLEWSFLWLTTMKPGLKDDGCHVMTHDLSFFRQGQNSYIFASVPFCFSLQAMNISSCFDSLL
ncbi:hypothetical protein N431DRAFT_234907 [Stipitochalara longipes BDJ]|nr:hypothetical protein N431DRAFT_234907 [Stipitochalara longipes BDJ]